MSNAIVKIQLANILNPVTVLSCNLTNYGFNQFYELKLKLTSTAYIHLENLLYKKIKISFSQEGESFEISGLITDPSYTGQNRFGYYYELKIKNPFELFCQAIQSQSFYNQTIIDVLKKILPTNTKININKTYPKLNQAIQYKQSNQNFIKTICDSHHIYFYFENNNWIFVDKLPEEPNLDITKINKKYTVNFTKLTTHQINFKLTKQINLINIKYKTRFVTELRLNNKDIFNTKKSLSHDLSIGQIINNKKNYKIRRHYDSQPESYLENNSPILPIIKYSNNIHNNLYLKTNVLYGFINKNYIKPFILGRYNPVLVNQQKFAINYYDAGLDFEWGCNSKINLFNCHSFVNLTNTGLISVKFKSNQSMEFTTRDSIKLIANKNINFEASVYVIKSHAMFNLDVKENVNLTSSNKMLITNANSFDLFSKENISIQSANCILSSKNSIEFLGQGGEMNFIAQEKFNINSKNIKIKSNQCINFSNKKINLDINANSITISTNKIVFNADHIFIHGVSGLA